MSFCTYNLIIKEKNYIKKNFVCKGGLDLYHWINMTLHFRG